jgi:hypothetical protein
MLRHPLGKVSLWSGLALVAAAQPAQAQLFPFGGACDCPQPAVQCAQPVMQTCYQTVPVTEFQPAKQVVRKPYIETKYVEQPVTEYHPVTETKVANVPTTTYQDVTEYRQVCRNTTQYVRQLEPVCKPSPCEIDSRPGMLGWLNRSTYDFASMFTPAYRTRVTAIPQTYVQNIPVTRRVAIQGTRQVAYNVTTMVAAQSTRRVAMNTVAYRDEEVTVMKPVTVMRTVPIGSAMAFGVPLYGAPRTAFGPTPDPISAPRAVERLPGDPNKFERTREATIPVTPKTSQRVPLDEVIPARGTSVSRVANDESIIPVRSTPSAVRVGQWVARTTTEAPAGKIGPTLSVANNLR